MKKEIYFVGKLGEGEGPIEAFSREVESRGHTVPEKWWQAEKIPKPYLDNPFTSAPAAERMLDAAYNCDVLIFFPTAELLGGAVELGAGIASKKINNDKLIIGVNPFEVRQSVFYAHPDVVAVRGLNQIREMNWF